MRRGRDTLNVPGLFPAGKGSIDESIELGARLECIVCRAHLRRLFTLYAMLRRGVRIRDYATDA